ncbi:transposase [bacterium]|nr:transposase [bacterium]
MDKPFFIYRTDLPHWRLKGATYYLTWRLHKTQSPMTPAERDRVASALEFFNKERYWMLAYVVMDDHVHLVFSLMGSETVQKQVQSWKTFSSKDICRYSDRTAPFWQPDYYDRIIRSENDLIEKIEYVLSNPERRWPGIRDYRWARFFPQE